MASLVNLSKSKSVVTQVEEAKNFFSRSKGLLGRSSLPADRTLWIHRCNSIHTWFMRFAIDVVFVDRDLIVQAVYENVRPWRLITPVWKASSVFEFSVGAISKGNIEKGDQLSVVN